MRQNNDIKLMWKDISKEASIKGHGGADLLMRLLYKSNCDTTTNASIDQSKTKDNNKHGNRYRDRDRDRDEH